jgi:hypothetical protein
MSAPLAISGLALPAQLPQIVCRRHQLPAQLERSFRLELGSGLQAHRYILGCPARLIAADRLQRLVRDLGMPITPERVSELLLPQLQRASTVYLGYEDAISGDSHRLYFEYWEEVVQRLRGTPATEIAAWSTAGRPLWEMGVGHKWRARPGTRSRQVAQVYSSRYHVRPLLPQGEILALAQRLLRAVAMPQDLLQRLLAVLWTISQHAPDLDPVFLEVSEPDSPRCSFDLCVHRLGLRLGDLEPCLTTVVQWFLGERHSLVDCLIPKRLDGWITHLSAGCSRRGLPYCCVYYEASVEQGPDLSVRTHPAIEDRSAGF